MAPILVVDDDELFRKLMVAYFRRLGLDASAVSSAQEALALLQSDSTGLELILLDIAMPELNGYDFARRVRENPSWDHLTLVAVTARKGFDVLEEAKAVGIDHVLTKPPEPHKLQALCEEVGLLPI